jgi:hypothetical protein
VQKNASELSAQLAERWARGQEEIAAARAAAGTAGHFMGMDESEAQRGPDLMVPDGMAGLFKISEMAALAEDACLAGCDTVFAGEESKDALVGWAAACEGADFSLGRRMRVDPPVLALRKNGVVATARLSEAQGTRLQFEVAMSSASVVVAKGVVRIALVQPAELLASPAAPGGGEVGGDVDGEAAAGGADAPAAGAEAQ